MKQVIDLDNWNRKEHFAFFSAFDDPFFGVTTLVDFTDVYRQSKEQNVSFFLYSLHFLLKCVNETDAFKLRIEKDSVVRYDTIHISPTIEWREIAKTGTNDEAMLMAEWALSTGNISYAISQIGRASCRERV